MIRGIKEYMATRVTPFDFIGRRHDGHRLRFGWCSVFPPTPNGAATVAYHFVKRLLLKNDIDVYAIPFGGRIDKSLLGWIKFARIEDRYLDAIIFFCIGHSIKDALKKTYAKTMVWQPFHESIITDPDESMLFEEMKNADMILTMTKGILREFQAKGVQKAYYLPAGIDTSKFSLSDNAGYQVLYASRVHYYKGVVSFLEAIPFILKVNRKVKFKLHAPIDQNTDHLSEISGLIDKMARDYPDNFAYNDKWLNCNQMQGVYQGSNIFVFPSENEGFGVPMVEAMSCGMPCIAVDKPPMNEIVKNNETGFCLPLREGIETRYHGYRFPHPEDIAQKILWLAENPAELTRMGKNARKAVEAEYDIDKCIDKLVSAVKEVVGGADR